MKKKEKSLSLKTERLALRVDPKRRYGLDLMARNQRRTLSAIIDWALDKALKDPEGGLILESEGLNPLTNLSSDNELDLLWHPDEAIRFVMLAYLKRDSLTYEEETLWELITNNAKFWQGDINQKDNYIEWDTRDLNQMNILNLKNDFELLKNINEGKDNKEIISQGFWAEYSDKGFKRNYSNFEDAMKLLNKKRGR